MTFLVIIHFVQSQMLNRYSHLASCFVTGEEARQIWLWEKSYPSDQNASPHYMLTATSSINEARIQEQSQECHRSLIYILSLLDPICKPSWASICSTGSKLGTECCISIVRSSVDNSSRLSLSFPDLPIARISSSCLFCCSYKIQQQSNLNNKTLDHCKQCQKCFSKSNKKAIGQPDSKACQKPKTFM